MKRIAFILLLIIGCQKVYDHSEPLAIETVKIPEGFTYSTSKETIINSDVILSRLFDAYMVNEFDTVLIGRFASEDEVSLLTEASSEIEIHPIGVPNKYAPSVLSISNSIAKKTENQIAETRLVSLLFDNVYAIGTWNIMGKPNYLEANRDILDVNFINDINASLPETRPVPTYNSHYLNGRNMNTHVTEEADVWITFVHEGAGWKNGLGYYHYPLNNPPSSSDEIDSLFIIFPNVSLSNSGGMLEAGDKVYMGKFPSNTGIGWFLIPNGFNTSTGILSQTSQVKNSTHTLNFYAPVDYRQHTILLNDEIREILLLGFEDTTRPNGDNDFNDAMFFISANPFSAIDVSELLPIQEATDSDGDGYFDHEDSYPNDPERSLDTWYPSVSGYSTFLVEDLWPATGDYDFNDLVADFRIHQINSSNSMVKEIEFEWIIKAVGGIQQNGLAVHLPINKNLISQITGFERFESYFALDANGVESNINETVILISDNLTKSLRTDEDNFIINVVEEEPKLAAKTIRVKVVFNSPISQTILGNAPFNPFVIANMERGKEIHLAGKVPTSKVNANLFGSLDDAGSRNGRPSYTTSKGLPWALLVSSTIPHVKEKVDFTLGYLNFADWASSNGSRNSDWYQNKTSYRNNRFLYLK